MHLTTFAAAVAAAAAPLVRAAAAPGANGTSTWGCAYLAAGGAVAVCTSEQPGATCCDGGGGETAVAWGLFTDGIGLATAGGWAQLAVHTSAAFPAQTQARAAGALEGYLTAARTLEFATNVHGGGTTWSPALSAYVEANLAYVARRAAEARGDPFWFHVGLAHEQQRGGYAGYAAAYAAGLVSAPLDNATYYALTLIGDMDDLCVVFGCTQTVSWRRARAAGGAGGAAASAADAATVRRERSLGDGHCSALVKPLGPATAPTDVLFAHTTWNPYEAMTRIYKLYDFPFTVSDVPGSATVPGRQIAFSSFPGTFYSFDDWYTTYPAALAVLETTIINNNASLWALVRPESVMDWARNMVANRLADDGASWAAYFARENSGTYNNMFLVLDYARVKAAVAEAAPLLGGTLTVVEQMPGVVVVEDATPHLQPGGAGYYASYNRVASPWLFELTNQTALVEEFGDHFSYSNYSRAQLFRAMAPSVANATAFRALMRHNDFAADAVGTQGCAPPARSASNAIAERGDLSPASGCACPGTSQLDEGAIDAKMTDLYLMTGGGPPVSIVVNGPTATTQPPFVWSASPFAHISHVGQPDSWDFMWAAMAPDFPPAEAKAPLVGTLFKE